MGANVLPWERAILRPAVALTWLHHRPAVWLPAQTAAVRMEPCPAASSRPGLGFIRERHLLYKPFRLEAFAFPIHSLLFF